MKKIILGITLLISVSSYADTCSSTYCAETIIDKGTTAVLKGLYIDFYPAKNLRLAVNKNEHEYVCKVMGYSAYVKKSAVRERKEAWRILAFGVGLDNTKVLTEVECVK